MGLFDLSSQELGSEGSGALEISVVSRDDERLDQRFGAIDGCGGIDVARVGDKQCAVDVK